MVTRQTLEAFKTQYGKDVNRWSTEFNARNGAFTEWSKLHGAEHPEFEERWLKVLEAKTWADTFSGAHQLTQKLIEVCDLQSPEMHLRLQFHMEDAAEVAPNLEA